MNRLEVSLESRLSAHRATSAVPAELISLYIVKTESADKKRPGSYQGNTLWWLGSAADGHHAQRRYTIHVTGSWPTLRGKLTGASRPEAIHDSCYPQRARIEPGPKLAESGSMILTAHSFLPSLAEIRLGWSRAVPRTRSVAQPGASHCARQFVLTVLAHALMTRFLTISVPIFEFYHTL